jgi:hypothetical protein
MHDIMLKREGADFVDEKSVVLNRARILPGEGADFIDEQSVVLNRVMTVPRGVGIGQAPCQLLMINKTCFHPHPFFNIVRLHSLSLSF